MATRLPPVGHGAIGYQCRVRHVMRLTTGYDDNIVNERRWLVIIAAIVAARTRYHVVASQTATVIRYQHHTPEQR